MQKNKVLTIKIKQSTNYEAEAFTGLSIYTSLLFQVDCSFKLCLDSLSLHVSWSHMNLVNLHYSDTQAPCPEAKGY